MYSYIINTSLYTLTHLSLYPHLASLKSQVACPLPARAARCAVHAALRPLHPGVRGVPPDTLRVAPVKILRTARARCVAALAVCVARHGVDGGHPLDRLLRDHAHEALQPAPRGQIRLWGVRVGRYKMLFRFEALVHEYTRHANPRTVPKYACGGEG